MLIKHRPLLLSAAPGVKDAVVTSSDLVCSMILFFKL